jgi:hypothetical protein
MEGLQILIPAVLVVIVAGLILYVWDYALYCKVTCPSCGHTNRFTKDECDESADDEVFSHWTFDKSRNLACAIVHHALILNSAKCMSCGKVFEEDVCTGWTSNDAYFSQHTPPVPAKACRNCGGRGHLEGNVLGKVKKTVTIDCVRCNTKGWYIK